MARMAQIMNIANGAAGAGDEAPFGTQGKGQVAKAYEPNDVRSPFGSCSIKRAFNLNEIETAAWRTRHFEKALPTLSKFVRVKPSTRSGFSIQSNPRTPHSLSRPQGGRRVISCRLWLISRSLREISCFS